MGAPRAAAVLIGFGWIAATSALAGDIVPPDLPQPQVTVEAAETSARPASPDVAPPDLPAVTVAVPPPAPVVAIEIALPDLPPALVTVTVADLVQTAFAARLAAGQPLLHPRLPRKDQEAMAAFYALGDFQPVWVRDGAWTPAAQRVIARLKAASDDGLDPTDYPIPALGVTKAETAADLAGAELKLAASAVVYARDARGGRLEPSRLSGLITPKLELPAADEVLTRLAAAADTDAALAAYNPPHAGYQALKTKLSELRAARPASAPTVRVPKGPPLRLGMRDPRVPLVRARFGLEGAADATVYDERVASAVAAFQQGQGLRADGVLTGQTIAALSGPAAARIEGDLVANMERWRWLPADLGPRHLIVNVPEFRLRLYDRGRVVHQTRVIVGKVETPTPIFSGLMDHSIVNPSWHIPPSILKKEILPRLAVDPDYAARLGYEVVRRGNQISVRQPPGERNALGFIKFMFPNNHAVYLHDTPNRRLFGAERRAFSHGCVRVDQPFQLAEAVLGPSWPSERLRRLIGQGERTIHLPEKLPVHLAYFTLSVTENGELRSLDDLYGHNRRVRAALGLDG